MDAALVLAQAQHHEERITRFVDWTESETPTLRRIADFTASIGRQIRRARQAENRPSCETTEQPAG